MKKYGIWLIILVLVFVAWKYRAAISEKITTA